MNKLGDRMKSNYESRFKHELVRRIPVIVRVDGRAFHTFTKGMQRPFDQNLIDTMVFAASKVGINMQGFKAAYIQSDEASFLMTDYDTLQTDAWFGYSKSKIETITASMMTASFNRRLDYAIDAYFDARSFNIPREEVSNYFLWRALDWERNSVSMYCSAYFSHKQMHRKNKSDQHEMLHSVGKNWATDLSEQIKNGTWVMSDGQIRADILPNYESISEALHPLIYCDYNDK